VSLRGDAETILRAALAAADPEAAVRAALAVDGGRLRAGDAEVEVDGPGKVWMVAVGKAAAAMARGASAALGERMAGGSVTLPRGAGAALPSFEVWEARHPIPDVHGLAGAADALQLAGRLGADDLLLFLLSGGASALWPAPPDGVDLADLQATTDALLRAGAPIAEINAVRKHLSRISGGRLARAAAPARVLTLAVADVIGATDDAIGSGPTLPDPTRFEDALDVLRRYDVRVPPGVLRHLQAGAAGLQPETVKPGELDNVLGFHRLLDVRDALGGAAEAATAAGYEAVVVSDRVEGEAREVGMEIADAALQARREGRTRAALLWGGETTVTVRGQGTGGRNQELALAAAIRLAGEPDVVLAALATDGRDGPTDAAGALVDGDTRARGEAAGLDPVGFLHANDSYHFLDATGDLLRPGPTGTNVNDVVVVLVG
jgi:glycerate-2-kinase